MPATPAPLAGQLNATDLRAEIYRNRRFELFATGLRWEDTRRLGQVGRTFAGKRCWLLYTIGGVVYGFQRPDPFPSWFGFHEVFHTFTIAAFICHYVAASIATYQVT